MKKVCFVSILIAFAVSVFSSSAQAQCQAGPAIPSVTICSPQDGQDVTTPTSIRAAAISSRPIVRMELWVDGSKKYEIKDDELDATLTLAQGSRRITVQAIDDSGALTKKTIFVNVVGDSPPPPPPPSGCTASSTDPSVTICAPLDGATVSSPVRVQALTTSSRSVVRTEVWVDGKKAFEIRANSIDTLVPMATGSRRVTVQAVTDVGSTFKSTHFITVGSHPEPPPPPPDGACAVSSTDPSISICSPAHNSSVTSPVRLIAAANSSAGVKSLQIQADGKALMTLARNNIDTGVTLAPGAHTLSVVGVDNAGRTFSKSVTVDVPPRPAPDLSKIRHIIIYIQENRSFDNYFGRMGQYRRDRGFNDEFDELPLDVALLDTGGHLVRPFHFRTVCHEGVTPSWNESHYAFNAGRMDNFIQITRSIPSTIDPHGTRAMGYYDWTDLPYYYELAFQFATSDRFFSSTLTKTQPNRMYLFSGTSFGHIRNDAPPTGGWTQPTFFDQLTQAGISWRYYYQEQFMYLANFSTWQRDKAKAFPISQWYVDVQNESTLPSVIFIERAPNSGLDEHPRAHIQKGAARTKQILDALMNSPSWMSSVFIFAYDEGGGLYDHVPPAPMPKPDDIPPMLKSGDLPGDFGNTGFRVPFIVVSPWVKPHYVSHVTRDFGSILRLIQVRFGIPPLTPRDALADDMSELFDFSAPARATPPPLPPQPTTGACNFSLQNAPDH